jgi:hypothetical protein
MDYFYSLLLEVCLSIHKKNRLPRKESGLVCSSWPPPANVIMLRLYPSEPAQWTKPPYGLKLQFISYFAEHIAASIRT